MFKRYLAFSALIAAAALGTAEASDDFKIQVGEKKTLPLGPVKGAALDNAKIADVLVLPDGRLSILGKANGEGKLSIIAANGKLTTAGLSVTGGKEIREPTSPQSYFGGKQVPDAYCGEPLNNGVANRSFNEAGVLLRADRTLEGIAKLEEALRIEPTAAILHLYLGAARAKIQDQARGAFHYETFALSCPVDPKATPVIEVLREFYRTLPKPADTRDRS